MKTKVFDSLEEFFPNIPENKDILGRLFVSSFSLPQIRNDSSISLLSFLSILLVVKLPLISLQAKTSVRVSKFSSNLVSKYHLKF